MSAHRSGDGSPRTSEPELVRAVAFVEPPHPQTGRETERDLGDGPYLFARLQLQSHSLCDHRQGQDGLKVGERFADALVADAHARDFGPGLFDTIRAFAGDAAQSDDRTLFVLDFGAAS